MELTLISLRASGTGLTGKHWATPFTSSQPAASRAWARSGIQARAAHALGDCECARLGTTPRLHPRLVLLSLPALYALLFTFFPLVVIILIVCFSQSSRAYPFLLVSDPCEAARYFSSYNVSHDNTKS